VLKLVRLGPRLVQMRLHASAKRPQTRLQGSEHLGILWQDAEDWLALHQGMRAQATNLRWALLGAAVIVAVGVAIAMPLFRWLGSGK
jgi:hypothetical protein